MAHVEVRLIGEASGSQIVNIFWYSTSDTTTLTDAQVEGVLNAFDTTVRTPYLGFMWTEYRLKQEIAQAYTHDFQRQPYLPYIREVDMPGTVAMGYTPQVVAAVLSARVEPVFSGHQRDPKTGNLVLRPVRRGYLSMGPLNSGDIGSDGRLTTVALATTRFTNLRNAFVASLSVPGLPTNPRPIRVSKLPDGGTIRGWGNILDARWRREISTRRSRKTGKGA